MDNIGGDLKSGLISWCFGSKLLIIFPVTLYSVLIQAVGHKIDNFPFPEVEHDNMLFQLLHHVTHFYSNFLKA